MSSKGLLRRLSRLAVVAAASSVVLASGVGMSAAYAAGTTTATDHQTSGTAGTSGDVSQPQPLSTADQNTGGANGQCPDGPYCSTRDGSPSGNGNGGGNATGEPCAACVGNADNKNPPGQMPNGSDPNNGFECDGNSGIGQTNPAHSGCKPTLVGSCVATTAGGVSWVLSNSNGFAVTAAWVSGSQSGTVTIPAATKIDNKTSTPGTVTFTTSGTSVKVTFPDGSFAEIDQTADCPPPPAITQTLAGHIYDCTSGTATTTEVTGGTLSASGPTTVASTPNPLLPAQVAAGDYTMTGTAPTGYEFVSCGVNTTANQDLVNVPAGGAGTGILYVEKTETPTPATLSLTVVKTNDADTDGIFHDTESAHTAGQDVTFEVRILNNSPVALVIDSAVDAFSSTSRPECASLIGTTLGVGQSVTCAFTVADYSPAAGGSLTDTVTVVGHQAGHPDNTTQGSDTSTVLTPTPPTAGAPDLAIVKVASKTGVTAGDLLTYTLTVSNVGTGATTGAVTVTDTVPSGLSLGGVNGGADWTCGTSGQTVTCTYNNGAIAPGQTVGTITINTTVLAAAVGTLTNTGVVSTAGDTNPTNDTSTVKTPVTAVLGEKIPQTPGTPGTSPGTPGTPGTSGTPGTPGTPGSPSVLPMTGTSVTALLPAALGMLFAGGLLVFAGARRRRA